MAQEQDHNVGERDVSISQLFGRVCTVLCVFSFRTELMQISHPCEGKFFISPSFGSALWNRVTSMIAVNLVWVVPSRAPLNFLTFHGFFRSQLQDHEEDKTSSAAILPKEK